MNQLSLFDAVSMARNRIVNAILDLDFDKAKEELERFKKSYPLANNVENVAILIDHFSNYTQQGDIHEMVALWFDFIRRKDDLSIKYPYLDNFRKRYFLKLSKIIEERDVDDDFIADIPTGLLFIYGNRINDGRKYLEKAISRYPDRSILFGYLGDAYYLRGDKSSERICYREAFEIDPYGINIDFIKDEVVNTLIHDISNEFQNNNEHLNWIVSFGCIRNVFPFKVITTLDDIKIYIEDFLKLEQEYKKTKNDKIKPGLFYKSMVLSESSNMLKFIKKVDLIKIRALMKEINPSLFDSYLKNKESRQ